MQTRLRKAISVFLLSTLLLNIGGELLLHKVLTYKSDRFFEKQTSRGMYNVNDLTEVKLPADLPGIADAGYTKVFGEVRFAGEAYNYVKMRITSTAIYLLCVPNYSTTHLCGQNVIHAENIPHIPISKKEHVPFGKLSIVGQSIFVFNNLELTVPVEKAPAFLIEHHTGRINWSLEIPQPPPKYFLAHLS